MVEIEQVVYGDVLFIINFSMDFLCLYICARLLHRKIKTFTMTLAASLGGVYGVFQLFLPFPKPILFAFDILVAILMCVIAFEFSFGNKISVSSVAFSGFVFFISEILLGGSVTAVFNLLSRVSLFDERSFVDFGYGETPFWMLIIVALASTVFTYVGGKLFSKNTFENSVEVKIESEGNSLAFSALVDSGNLLNDPISGKPVVIVGFEKIKNFMPREFRTYISDEKNGIYGDVPYEMARKIRFIPSAGIGEGTILFGFVPDSMVIISKKNKRSVDAVLAIDKKVNDFGGYDAIVPARLVSR